MGEKATRLGRGLAMVTKGLLAVFIVAIAAILLLLFGTVIGFVAVGVAFVIFPIVCIVVVIIVAYYVGKHMRSKQEKGS